MKKSSVGLDRWSHLELAALPQAAWQSFLEVIRHSPRSLFSSLSAIYKRVPIPKNNQAEGTPSSTRPIDVFSVLLRVFSTATSTLLRDWTPHVLRPCQMAAKGGVIQASARIALLTEGSYLQLYPTFGLSIDFEKMYNMMSGRVAAQAAAFMGLDVRNALNLLLPLENALGIWRLPYNCEPTPFRNTRGLPQCMGSSVLLAELCVCALSFGA